MGIGFLLTIYLLGSGLLVLSLCRAAARPTPMPDGIAGDDELVAIMCGREDW